MSRSDSMRRWIYLGVSWLVLSGLLAGLLTCPRVQKGMLPIARLLVTWDLNLSDRLLATLPPLKADPDFLFLGIDDSSMAMGEEDPEVVSRIRPLSLMAEPFPWSREVWATATERLLDAGARLVVIDLLLVAPGKGDATLQAVLEKHAGRVVLASSLSPPATSQGFAGGFGSLVDPSETILPGEGNALPSTGFVNFRPDLDGNVRTVRYYDTLESIAGMPDRPESKVYPSLSAAVLEALGEEIPLMARRNAVRIPFAPDLTAINAPRPLYEIFWPSTWERNYRNGEQVRDKVVLIGPAAAQFHDNHPTPAGTLLGPQLHLNAIAAARAGAFARPISAKWSAFLILGAGLIAMVIVGRLQRPWLALALLTFATLAFVGGARIALGTGAILPLLGPLASLCLVGATGLAFDHARIYRERLLLRRALERRVSAEVMEEILANPSSYLNQLGGLRKQVTVLFSDLRGFTSLSESASPEEMVSRLNAYFDLMVGEIQGTRGMVDKFIGDAIMAIWGSVPSLPPSEGVKQAVASAMGMIRQLECLNERWKTEMGPESAPQWAMGIGIHCGEAITGNIGSESRLELTVIGDAVNLASRLEGVTKRYGVALLVSEAAAAHLRDDPDQWVLRPIDRVRVSGRRSAVTLFEPLSVAKSAPVLVEAVPDFSEAFAAYQRCDFEIAAERYAKLAARFPGDVSTRTLMTRCREFGGSPPPSDWEGAVTLDSK
ncbi:MAG: adenylate/guanylate cyclase domain-containing protein [Verrucomicrobiae bacterium]|nr:adenylate/guanylate cyclase domain-containing protein [Verrucomicrobiae bacterium]